MKVCKQEKCKNSKAAGIRRMVSFCHR